LKIELDLTKDLKAPKIKWGISAPLGKSTHLSLRGLLGQFSIEDLERWGTAEKRERIVRVKKGGVERIREESRRGRRLDS